MSKFNPAAAIVPLVRTCYLLHTKHNTTSGTLAVNVILPVVGVFTAPHFGKYTSSAFISKWFGENTDHKLNAKSTDLVGVRDGKFVTIGDKSNKTYTKGATVGPWSVSSSLNINKSTSNRVINLNVGNDKISLNQELTTTKATLTSTVSYVVASLGVTTEGTQVSTPTQVLSYKQETRPVAGIGAGSQDIGIKVNAILGIEIGVNANALIKAFE